MFDLCFSVPVRLGMQSANVSILAAKQNLVFACGNPNLGEDTAKPRKKSAEIPQQNSTESGDRDGVQEGFGGFTVSAEYPVRLGNRTYRTWGRSRFG